jgi:hypothetical protein
LSTNVSHVVTDSRSQGVRVARGRHARDPRGSVEAGDVMTVSVELTKVLTSPQFQAIWTATLTGTHRQLVAVLRGQNTAARDLA